MQNKQKTERLTPPEAYSAEIDVKNIQKIITIWKLVKCEEIRQFYKWRNLR